MKVVGNRVLKSLNDIPKKLLPVNNNNIESFVRTQLLKEEAIEWIKNDIEESTGFQPEKLSYWHRKLPNGKVCHCDPEGKCDFHKQGERMMKFLNITEDDLK